MIEGPTTPPPVDDRTLRRVLTWLNAAGVEFVLNQPPHGEFVLEPHEVLDYLAHPEAFVAEAMGVTVEDYRAWQAAEGSIQCHAQTKSGRRCRNMIAEADHYLTPRQWVALQARQLTCWSHGGSSLTAREMWEVEA